MIGRSHILVVDDDDLLTESLRTRLTQDGYLVGVASCADAALAYQLQYAPDLILLDIGLPDGDGFDVGGSLQRQGRVPVIFLTGRTNEIDKVTGLALGDDYVTKPFSLLELEARINLVLRRYRQATQHPGPAVIEVGGVRLDTDRHQVQVRGEEVELSPKEFELLQLLLSHAGQVLATNEIISAIWGPEYVGDHDLLYVHVSWLRRKIYAKLKHHKLIQTVRGIGYGILSEEGPNGHRLAAEADLVA